MNKEMTVTRDMVIDLLPLYAAGEVSADSRRAVEQFLAGDAELHRLAENLKRVRLPQSLDSDESRAFERTRSRIRNRSWHQALAILFSLLPFSFVYSTERGLVWWMLRDQTPLAILSLACAISFWALLLRRKL